MFSCGFPLSFVIQAYQANSICVMDTLDAWALCAQPNAYIWVIWHNLYLGMDIKMTYVMMGVDYLLMIH